MKIVVFGAGGGVGSRAVAAAAAAGHDVVAVARSTDTLLAASATGVAVVGADVRDAAAVQRVLVGAQAVLWCVGVSKRSGPDVGRASMPHVVRASQEQGVARLVSVSGAGVTLPGDAKGAGARFISALTRRFARDLVEDKEGEHEILAGSTLAWTEVRPPRLTDAPGTGSWVFTDTAPGLRAAGLSRVDVAAAMLSLAGSSEYVHRSPFIVAGPPSS
jgi:putative NADH-flavin reductase